MRGRIGIWIVAALLTTMANAKTKPGDAMPHNPTAERDVLGAVLMNPKYMADVAEILRPDDFFLDANRRIFATLLQLDREGVACDDLTLVLEELQRRGELEPAGGVGYLSALIDGVPKVSNARHYAQLVKRYAVLRAAAYTGENITQNALAGGDPSEILDRAEEAIAGLRDDQAVDSAPVTIKRAVQESYPTFERLFEGEGVMLGVPTGYPVLDRKIAGWISGYLVVLGARPSAGKTAMAVEFVLRSALAKRPAHFESLEMTRVEIVLRMACLLARVESHRMRSGHLDNEEKRKLTEALGELRELPITISEPARLTSRELVHRLRRLAERDRVRLAVVDYLQLLDTREKHENRTQQVGQISRDLKEAARWMGKISGGTLIAISQLTRIPANQKPTLEDFRESGQIEQDADVALALWNKKGKSQAEDQVKMLGLLKQRNGPIGDIPFVFLSKFMGFEPAADESQIEPDAPPEEPQSRAARRKTRKHREPGEDS